MMQLCEAYRTERVSELPHRKVRKALPVRSSQVWLIRDESHIWLERRQACGIWGGLLSLPDAGSVELPRHAELLDTLKVRHRFTHFELEAEVTRYRIRTTDSPMAKSRHCELDAYPLAEAENLALPTPWRKLLVRET